MATGDRAGRPHSEYSLCRPLAAACILAGLCAAHAACGSTGDIDEAYRLLDRTCAQPLPDGPACHVTGAEQTQGITADTLGFRLGPSGADTVTIHLQAIDSIQGPGDDFDLEILAARTQDAHEGEVSALFQKECDADPQCQPPAVFLLMEPEYKWYPIVTAEPRPAAFSYGAALVLTGKNADIADIRTRALDPAGCSVARPGAR